MTDGYAMPFTASNLTGVWADDLSEDGVTLSCAGCGDDITEVAYPDGATNCYRCEDCTDRLIQELTPEAEQHASEHCKVEHLPPPYDPDLEYRCTPEDYEAGARESYTPNAYRCYVRHRCTNYDELIKGLSRENLAEQIKYHYIRQRTDELVEEAIQDAEVAHRQGDDGDVGEAA